MEWKRQGGRKDAAERGGAGRDRGEGAGRRRGKQGAGGKGKDRGWKVGVARKAASRSAQPVRWGRP